MNTRMLNGGSCSLRSKIRRRRLFPSSCSPKSFLDECYRSAPAFPYADHEGRQRSELCTATIKSATLSRDQLTQFLKTEVSMLRFLFVLALAFCAGTVSMQSQDHKTAAADDYLFVWAGDADHKGNDFLAVIDADPSSA